MDDAETVTTTVEERRPVSAATVRFSRLKRPAARRLTRAHLALAERPQLARAAAEALDTIGSSLSKELACDVTLEAHLSDVAVCPFGGLSRFSAFALFELGPLGAVAALEIDLQTLGAILNRVAGTEGRPSLPLTLTRIEEAATGWLLLVALEALRHSQTTHQRFAPRLLALSNNRGEVLERLDCRQRHLAFEVRAAIGDAQGQLRLLVPALPMQAAVQDIEPERPPDTSPEVLAATIDARAFVGHSILGAADLDALDAGDVVLFDGVRRENGVLLGSARLQSASFELYGNFGVEGFQFIRAHTRALTQEQPMASDEGSDPMPPLPVEVEIELTRVRLPISELATLRAGAVVRLHINSSEPVTLRVGDRAVARAELVDIDGEIGARIINLLKASPA